MTVIRKMLLTIHCCQYKDMFPQAGKEHVKKKFNSLRTNYRKELKKHLQSMKSGTVDIYQPTLRYFNEMFFLQDQESTLDSQSSMDAQTTISSPERESERSYLENCFTKDTLTIEGDQPPSTTYAISKTKAKKLKIKIDDVLLKLAAKNLRKKPDECQNWALSCAADIKNGTNATNLCEKCYC